MRNLVSLFLALILFVGNAHALTGTVLQADTVSGLAADTNYWSGGDAEKPVITDIRYYNDGAVSRPIDCAGGSVSGLTMNRGSFAALTNKYSWNIEKQSGNKQGMGIAVDFTVDKSVSSVSKMATTFEYIRSSGTFTVPSSPIDPADSDIVVALYDRTAAKLVSTTDGRFFRSSGAEKDDFLQAWISTADSTAYTLCFHLATSTANAFTVKIDSGKIQKSKLLLSARMATNEASYTPTLTNFGTGATSNLKWYQDGSNLFFRGTITCGTSVPANTVSIALPAGYTMAANVATYENAGTWIRSASTTNKGGFVLASPNASLMYISGSGVIGTSTEIALTPAAGSSVCQASETISLNARIPISGASNYMAVPTVLADTQSTNSGPITITATTTNPTKGTTTVDRVWYSYQGEGARIRGEYLQTTAGTAGSGDYLFTLPAGMKFDSNKIRFHTASVTQGRPLAAGVALSSAWVSQGDINGASMYPGAIIPYDATRFRIVLIYTSANTNGYGLGVMGAGGPGGMSNNPFSISFDFVAPIEGRIANNGAYLGNGTLSTDTPDKPWVYRSATVGGATILNSCTVNGLCGIYNQTSNWLSVNYTGSGAYTITFPDGTWTGNNYNCTFETNNWGASNYPTKCLTMTRSQTSLTLNCYTSNSGAAANTANFVARCDGPK